MKAVLAAVLPLLALVTPSVAVLEARDIHANLKKRFGVTAHNNTHLDLVGDATFNQLLDHSDPSKGTFKQRYWWNGEHYKKGGPVFLFNPGESSADEMLGYLEEEAIPGLYAETFGGAAIVIEHRYWGQSNPFKNHTAETLQYLNLPNSMKDMTNFAMNATLEFCEAGDCNANDVPWVLIGGSYAGALAAWTSQKEPGVFAAYHASSAVVHAISDFWTYFAPIESALPRNCSVDVRSVVAHVDKTFESNDQAAITALKTKFGLQSLNGADFADILANPLSEWQGDQKVVYQFCEYLETLGGTVKPSPTGQGLSKALDAYAAWIIKTNPKCGKGGSGCNTYDTRIAWNTPTLIDDHRPWQWMLCNEPFGWWQIGPAKSDGTNIVSSQMRPEHYSRRCNLMFPETNKVKTGFSQGFTEKHHVMWSKGWDAPYKNVLFVDGEYDPWRSATVSSKYRANGYANTTTAPLYIVKGGVHCPELWINKNNPYKWEVVQAAIRQMGVWLKEWKKPSA